MEQVLRVRVTVKRYTWHEFVHDVVFVLYVAIIIFNRLSKRCLRHSIPEIYRTAGQHFTKLFDSVYGFLRNTLLIILFIEVGGIVLIFAGIFLMAVLGALGTN